MNTEETPVPTTAAAAQVAPAAEPVAAHEEKAVVDSVSTGAGSNTAASSEQETPTAAEEGVVTPPKTAKFWLIIAGLLVATFLAAIDLTAVSTALPTIAEALKSQDYAWIGNSYSITSTIIVPWSGGLADTFGRRPVLLSGLVFFFIGSAMCGAADTMNVMLAGRSFQGIGSGIILSLVEIVLADLVSLSERGAYQGAFGAVWALASAIGPVIGGAFAATNYRGLFYMNLPLSAIIFGVVAAYMDLPTPSGTLRHKLSRMDWYGNLIFIPSLTLFIVALLSGGQQYAWTSANVLAPLIIGVFGLVLWYVVERYYIEHPTVPFKLLSNTTTTIGYATTFLHGIVALALFYFWPVYFQSVQGASPVQSAVDFFSVAFIVAPFAMLAGGTIGALQVYKPHNVIAWVLITIGLGLMSLVNASSSKAAQVGLPIVMSIGVGLLYSATVFVVLAPLPPSLAGRALAFLVFVRNFGNILGITVGSNALAQELAKRLPADYLATIPGGVAGAYSAIPSIKFLPEPLQSQVVEAFAQSVRTIWLVLIPFGAIGLFTAVFMKTYKLADVTDASWGLEHPGQNSSEEDVEKSGEKVVKA